MSTSKIIAAIAILAIIVVGVFYFIPEKKKDIPVDTSKVEKAKKDLVMVSWGGAYTKSQQLAYHDPYMKNNPEINIINDDSSSEATAKIRAQAEAGNITWDVVDVVAADAITLCDEGLIEEIDHDTVLAKAPDGTSASKDFGDLIVSPCFVPQIVYSTTFGYRTDKVGSSKPTSIADVFDLEKFPGKRALEKKPIISSVWGSPFR